MADEASDARTNIAAPSLLRSGALSLATSAAPLALALIALPLLTRQLGTERLGLLSLAWAWLGYAALLDFGLGRAITRLVATSDAADDVDAPVAAFVATGAWLLAIVGAAVGLGGALLAPWYVSAVLRVSESLRSDAMIAAVVFALTVPAITGASVPRAVLEARQQFRTVNLVRLPVSVGTFGVPLVLLPFTMSLSVIAITLAVLRLWAWWRYTTLARRCMPPARGDHAAWAHLRPLLRSSAWMTISNVLSPLMTVADRFVIGSLVSVSAVALYAVPWEAVTKLWIVPGALTMVLFPAIARVASMDASRLSSLHAAGIRIVALIVVPACGLTALFAPALLRFAGGAQYTGDSVTVLRILAIGLAANCIATVPFTLLQASGRARWTAMLHLCETVPFVLLLWYSVQRWGITGAAFAWTTRVVLDAGLLAWRAQSVAPLSASMLLTTAAGVVIVALAAVMGATTTIGSTPTIVAALTLVITPVVLWLWRGDSVRLVLGANGMRR